MFESSQWADADAEFPVLAAAIADIPAPTPGGDAITAGGRLRALLILQRRLQAQLLEQVASFDAQGFATGYGASSTQAWVRAYASLDPAQTAALVGAARLTRTLPLLAGQLSTGQIGVEHLTALDRATRAVPDEVLAGHDPVLLSLSRHARPRDLARAGERITEVHLHDTVQADPDQAGAARRVSLAQTFDGIWALDGRLTSEDGAKLAAALEPLIRRRGPEDDRSPQQRRADGLTELVDIALRSGQLPQAGGDRTRITLLVHLTAQAPTTAPPTAPAGQRLSLGDLAGALTGIGPGEVFAGSRLAAIFGDGASARQLLGSHATITDQALARIGCDADLNLAILNQRGDVLHQGRTSRDPTVAQTRALVVRDRGCVFPGCDRPPAACQAHHLIFWSHHGPTDLDNLALVCGFHHTLIHDQHWHLQRLDATAQTPHGGWQATAPHGMVLTQHRQQAA